MLKFKGKSFGHNRRAVQTLVASERSHVSDKTRINRKETFIMAKVVLFGGGDGSNYYGWGFVQTLSGGSCGTPGFRQAIES
jgi:hypothetical protein